MVVVSVSPPAIALFMTPTVILTLVGGLFIILSYVLFKEYRNKSPLHSCIVCMAISDWMMVFTWYVPIILGNDNTFLCDFQAYSLEIFAQATMFWTSIFAVRLYIANMTDLRPRYEEIISHLVGWGIPFAMSIGAGAFGLYGHAGQWCWIDDSYPLEQILMGDGLSVIMFAIELFVFTSLLYQLREGEPKSKNSILQRNKRLIVTRFGLFLLIPPVCWSFGLTDRLMGYIDGKHLYWVQVMQAIATTSQGFLNALVYGWDGELQALWIKLLIRKFKAEKQIEKKPLLAKTLGLMGEDASQQEAVPVNVNDLYANHASDI